jgi:hypothetical protein
MLSVYRTVLAAGSATKSRIIGRRVGGLCTDRVALMQGAGAANRPFRPKDEYLREIFVP